MPQFLVMDYGTTYKFTQINIILLSLASYQYMEAYMVSYMDGVEISLLDKDGNTLHYCDKLQTDSSRFSKMEDQVYVIDCHSAEGRKVMFETNKDSPLKRAILVVDTWAQVEIIFPGTEEIKIKF